MPIAEIFLSVQGEGINAGSPSVFLRTYFCNLTCTWCDSKYTWQNQQISRPGVDYKSMAPDEVLRRVMQHPGRHLVLTGGEPLLHQKLLIPVLKELTNVGWYVEVETNGTLAPTEELVELVDCFNVSPKTSNSLVDSRVRIRGDVLESFVKTDRAWFKFVVADPNDMPEIEALITAYGLPRNRVILMPEGTDPEMLLSRSRWIVELCKENGFRFSPRLQILLFGNRRGT